MVGEFLGILCVDKVYQGRLALLLAVGPSALDGDRLVGYQLVHGDVEVTEVGAFWLISKKRALTPDEVVII